MLTQFCQEALIFTSNDKGGVESRVRIIAAVSQPFYRLPDTLVEILGSTTIGNLATKSIRSMPPQYAEGLNITPKLAGVSESSVPLAYFYWDDTLQLIPIPSKVDTSYFFCYVEHPRLTLDTATIRLLPAFTEAAIYYVAGKIMERLEEYDHAAYFFTRYDIIGKAARERYARKLDLLPAR